MKTKIYYYASCENILVMGPYENEAEAWERLRLSEMESIRQKRIHAKDAHVWASYSPNEVSEYGVHAEKSLETSWEDNVRQASKSLWNIFDG